VNGQWFHHLQDYQILLQRLYGLHQHLERTIGLLSGHFGTLELAGRERSSLIEADMASLNVPSPVILELVPLPFQNAADVLGALYVIEGSTLGGPAIGRLLHHRLGLTNTCGASSFNPYGGDTADRWDEFCDFLRAWPGDHRAVLVGANAMFCCYESWVLRPPHLGE
jgi:heme oxygenase (biliverdin-IX-beta and delta-forming)